MYFFEHFYGLSVKGCSKISLGFRGVVYYISAVFCFKMRNFR